MNEWIALIGLIAVIVGVFAVFAVIKYRKQKELLKKYPGYPKGYWMNQGVGIGIAIGAGLGAAFKNVAIGVAIGIAIGSAIGMQLEKKHKDEIRPLTEEERELRKQTIRFMVGTLIVGLAVFILIFFAMK